MLSATCPSTIPPTSCPRVPLLLSSAPTFAPMPHSPFLLTSPAQLHLLRDHRSPNRACPFFSKTYKPILPQPLYIHIHTKPPGCHPFTPCLRANSQAREHKTLSFHGLAASCSLLPLFLAVALFVFNRLQPLFTKHGGWGIVSILL